MLIYECYNIAILYFIKISIPCAILIPLRSESDFYKLNLMYTEPKL